MTQQHAGDDEQALRRAVQALLGTSPSPTRRQQLAALLDRLAAEQRGLAEAVARQQRRPPEERLAPRTGTGGRPAGRFVRIERVPRESGPERVYVHIGRGTYYDAERLDVQLLAGRVHLIPVRGDAGYAVVVTSSYVRVQATGARDLLAHLPDGRYDVEVRANILVIGEPQSDQGADADG